MNGSSKPVFEYKNMSATGDKIVDIIYYYRPNKVIKDLCILY